METKLVRLKPRDPRRGHVIKRYTYRGIKFDVTRSWYRVPADVAEHLRSVRQKPSDPSSQRAFDVLTESEAKAVDVKEARDKAAHTSATDDIHTSFPRPEASGAEAIADAPEPEADGKAATRKGKKDRG